MVSQEFAGLEHQPQHQRFVLPVGDALAVVEYKLTDDAIDFVHTWVPPELRGGGHAQALVRYALNWAESEKLKISASCWYVHKFLNS